MKLHEFMLLLEEQPTSASIMEHGLYDEANHEDISPYDLVFKVHTRGLQHMLMVTADCDFEVDEVTIDDTKHTIFVMLKVSKVPA